MPSYAVVGGSRGIGLEFVRQLSANPDNTVFVLVRDKARSSHLASVVAAAGNNIHVFQADVAAAAEIAQLTGGGLDVLIHNAARLEGPHLYRNLTNYESEEQLDEDFLQFFKVNVLGVVHTVNAFLPLLRKGTAKKIIILAYGTTKAGTHMVVTKYAALLENEGFTVVALSPGLVDTSATAVVDESDRTPAQTRAGTLADVDTDKTDYNRRLQDITAITPEESVKGMLKVIQTVGPADTGAFLWTGNLSV
ncbi:predicted protein [Sparassis crispa]|uniref:NAD(P)-binding protein n=1 Tax=Sparassis crispa TaxID=139825 RepID=A0A401GSP5_9APHY|nr:predicted protein [Sparassis crispa]GBE85213.1 predicted protein [Sparassis crispa]